MNIKSNKQTELRLVSIVIPSYNHAKFVQQSIQSVIDQDYQNIELIIIDDGSTDNSVDAIQQMVPACEKRFVRFKFRHRPNKGLPATLNEALDWCKGEFFAPLASDDMIMPHKTTIQVNYLSVHKNCAGVFGGIILIDDHNKVLRNINHPGLYHFNQILLHDHFLPAPSAMLRLREVNNHKYDPCIKIEDWNMWLKLTKNGLNLVCLNDVLAYYRKHCYNFSSNYKTMEKEGFKILMQYKENKIYQKSLANYHLALCLMAATDNKKESLSYLINFFLLGFFSKKIFLAILKILIPKKIISIYSNRVYKNY